MDDGAIDLRREVGNRDNKMPDALSASERRLLEWLAMGKTHAQIADCIGRSEKTVRNQLARVYQKSGAANRTEAVALYLKRLIGFQVRD